MTDPVILSDEALAEIEAHAASNTGPRFGYTYQLCLNVAALCQTVRAAWAELGRRERTMKFWEDSYLAEHETWGNCKWKAENAALREQLAHATEYGEKLARNYSSLEDWILRIRIKLGLQAKDADIEGAVETLQSKLAQVEKERDDARQKLMRRCTHPNTYPLKEATRRCHDCGAEILL